MNHFRTLLVSAFLAGCSGTAPPDFSVPDRLPGSRTPLTATCDPLDTSRCLLPWPSSTYTVADASTATGLRVHVDSAALIAADDPAAVNLADGFSRVTPLVTAFPGSIASLPTSTDGKGPLRLILAQPGAADFGTAVPLRFDVQHPADDPGTESFIFGYPLRPLAAKSDYVAVVLDELPVTGGAQLSQPHITQVALGLASPESLDEAKLAAYHAPTRAVLARAGIDPHHVLRVWDFTTRSDEDAQKRLAAMRAGALAAVAAGQVTVNVDKVEIPASGPIAMIATGHLSGLPMYLPANPGSGFTLDAKEVPMAIGTREAPFRVVVPAGSGNYRFVMFGHGTGGNYQDDTLDAELAAGGAAKVGIQFDGWTDTEVIPTFLSLVKVIQGSRYATGMLMQALADGAAVQTLLGGAIGDALAAPMIAGMPNPAAGRRPDPSHMLWAGGSLGGIMSLVAVCADSTVRYGVLNVPGAAWTHYVPKSLLFAMMAPLLDNAYQGDLNALHAVAASQGVWDEIDGAAWSSALAGRNTTFLIQESIGDPVVPNAGSEMVAVVTSAKQVGAVLVPIAAGIPQAAETTGESAITQFRVASTDPYQIHGFADTNTPAGMAAREQIAAFVSSAWAGKPTITVPASCPSASCDFSSP